MKSLISRIGYRTYSVLRYVYFLIATVLSGIFRFIFRLVRGLFGVFFILFWLTNEKVRRRSLEPNGWLSLQEGRDQDFQALRKLPSYAYSGLRYAVVNHVIIIILVAAAAFGSVWWEVATTLRVLLSENLMVAFNAASLDQGESRGIAYLIVASTAALIALASAPFALLRAWVNDRQAQTSEDKHLTERIMRAVEQLGTEKTVKVDHEFEAGKFETFERTEPNVEVRIGAIYALERISQESEKDHITVMETLCAYITSNSHNRNPSRFNLASWRAYMENATDITLENWKAESSIRFGDRFEAAGNIFEWTQDLPIPRPDIQAALSVIGRRKWVRIAYERRKGFSCDLAGANLQRAKLSGLDFSNALFGGAFLDGAFCHEANFEGAALNGVSMIGANLKEATLNRANLRNAVLDGASLEKVRMWKADCTGASMSKVNLALSQIYKTSFSHAALDGADVSYAQVFGAYMHSADLRFVSFYKSNLSGAILIEAKIDFIDIRLADARRIDFPRYLARGIRARGADLRNPISLEQKQLNAIHGDQGTRIPENLKRSSIMSIKPFDYVSSSMGVDRESDEWLEQGAPVGEHVKQSKAADSETSEGSR